MLKLSDYIGQVLTDVATGREIADRNSAALSERYQADTFMKGMPVPHYTIDEASFELPFMIVGVVTQGKMDEGLIEGIVDSTRERTTALIHFFILEKTQHEKVYGSDGRITSRTEVQNKEHKEIIGKIVEALVKHVRISIEEEGLKMIKLLDLVDSLCSHLGSLIEKKFSTIEGEDNPFTNPENIKLLCEKYRRVLFNEYKDIISTTNGVIVDASTGKLNEYAEDNCLTHLKVTLREQDLDFIIEQDEKSGSMKRFLSLN